MSKIREIIIKTLEEKSMSRPALIQEIDAYSPGAIYRELQKMLHNEEIRVVDKHLVLNRNISNLKWPIQSNLEEFDPAVAQIPFIQAFLTNDYEEIQAITKQYLPRIEDKTIELMIMTIILSIVKGRPDLHLALKNATADLNLEHLSYEAELERFLEYPVGTP